MTNRYHPSVKTFLEHADQVRTSSGWEQSFRKRAVERITVTPGGFELDGERPFAHVLVATGHPGLSTPESFASDRRAVHAYELHEYASRVSVVGAGMANTVAGTQRDGNGDPTRNGVAIEAHYFAKAKLAQNTIVASPGGVGAFDNSTIEQR